MVSKTSDLYLAPVDFQRDFIEEGGFGEVQGGSLAAVQDAVKPAAKILKLSRRAGLMVVHTREGHEPSLRDCPTCKVDRLVPLPWIDNNRSSVAYTTSKCSWFKTYCGNWRTGSKGQPFTRPGGAVSLNKGLFDNNQSSFVTSMHDLVDELRPIPGEFVIDKPGKGRSQIPVRFVLLTSCPGAFYATELHQILINAAVSHIIIVGVTTECCVTTTLREANDRGKGRFSSLGTTIS